MKLLANEYLRVLPERHKTDSRIKTMLAEMRQVCNMLIEVCIDNTYPSLKISDSL